MHRFVVVDRDFTRYKMVGAVRYHYLVLLAISYFQTIGTIYEISLSAAVQPMSHDLCGDIIGQQSPLSSLHWCQRLVIHLPVCDTLACVWLDGSVRSSQ